MARSKEIIRVSRKPNGTYDVSIQPGTTAGDILSAVTILKRMLNKHYGLDESKFSEVAKIVDEQMK